MTVYHKGVEELRTLRVAAGCQEGLEGRPQLVEQHHVAGPQRRAPRRTHTAPLLLVEQATVSRRPVTPIQTYSYLDFLVTKVTLDARDNELAFCPSGNISL